jgi:Thermolysin metallopeptidase, alpha-helical domain
MKLIGDYVLPLVFLHCIVMFDRYYPVISIHDFSFECYHYNDYARLRRVEIADSIPSSNPASIAYSNTRIVANFLNRYLSYRGIDGDGRAFVVIINCIDRCRRNLDLCNNVIDANHTVIPDQCQVETAFKPFFLLALSREDRYFFLYGQAENPINHQLKSCAYSLTAVAHEIFHAVTHFTSRLSPGFLNESYSDIFAVIVANEDNPNVQTWDWNVYNIPDFSARNLSVPTRLSTPQNINNRGNPHRDQRVHNYAAYLIITAVDEDNQSLFYNDTQGIIKLFYCGLEYLKEQPQEFIDSYGSLVEATAKASGNDPIRQSQIKNAIDSAFLEVHVLHSFD